MQQKAILLSIYLNHRNNQGRESSSGEIYSTYCELVKKLNGINQLTSRRVSSLVKEIELAGITSSKLVSFGRKGGRTRMISLKIEDLLIKNALKSDSRCENLIDYIPTHIKRSDVIVHSGRKFRTLY